MIFHKYCNVTFVLGKIGITIDAQWYEPKTNTTKDVMAAERALQMNVRKLSISPNFLYRKKQFI